jgi:hypothetical protein
MATAGGPGGGGRDGEWAGQTAVGVEWARRWQRRQWWAGQAATGDSSGPGGGGGDDHGRARRWQRRQQLAGQVAAAEMERARRRQRRDGVGQAVAAAAAEMKEAWRRQRQRRAGQVATARAVGQADKGRGSEPGSGGSDDDDSDRGRATRRAAERTVPSASTPVTSPHGGRSDGGPRGVGASRRAGCNQRWTHCWAGRRWIDLELLLVSGLVGGLEGWVSARGTRREGAH